MRSCGRGQIYRCDGVDQRHLRVGQGPGIDHHLPYLGISSIYLFAVSPVMTLV